MCVDFSRELLEIMKDHLAAEQELYNAAFVLKDTVAAHEANLRAVSLLQRSAELRVRFETHSLAEHGGGGLELLGEAPQS